MPKNLKPLQLYQSLCFHFHIPWSRCCVTNRGDVLFILLIMCFIRASMLSSLTGMHIPFIKTDTGPLLWGFHQAKTPIMVSDWLACSEKKKYCWCSPDTQHPNYAHTDENIHLHRSHNTDAHIQTHSYISTHNFVWSSDTHFACAQI